MAEATTTPQTVRVELLGAPRLVLGGARVQALERKDAALLALLALDGRTARTRLAALLWPEVDAEGARNNLRQRLFRLRRLAGRDLVSAGETLALAAGVEHDLVEQAQPEATGVRTELLGTLDYADCGELAEWVTAARAAWHRGLRAALERRADQLECEGRIAAALQCADHLVADDPLAEAPVQRLMRLHARRGDRAAALAAYRRWQQALARELAAQPSPSIRSLAARIEAGAPIDPGAPRAQPLAVLRPPRLVGRDAEWRALEQAWNAGRPVLVLGEPGIGKSRLLADFAATRGDALRSGARPGDDATSYGLLARLVRALIARYDAPGVAWVRGELARLVPELGAPAAGALNPLRLVQALVQCVAHAHAAGFSGIVLDDLHHADQASLEAVVVLMGHDGVRGLRLLGGARTGEEPQVLREWRQSGDALEVRVDPLTLEGVAALLASLDLPGLDTQAAATMFRRTGGNPLFVLETLRAASSGSTALDGSLPAPVHVEELIARRLSRLPAAAQELAQVAALAGQDFTAELAAFALHRHALDIADAWRALETAQILRDGGFAHDLILEAAQRALPEQTARALHRSIGEFLEARGAPPARVAAHWFGAGEWHRAALQFNAAARARFDASRYLEAGALFRRAADCFGQAGDQPERHAALQELAGCQIKSFDLSGARAVAEELRASASNEEQRGWALDRLVDVLNMSRANDRAAEDTARAMRQLGHTSGKPWMVFNATRKLAVGLAHQGRHADALALFDTQDAWVQENQHEWNVHVWLCDQGYVLDLADRRERAGAVYLKAELLARRHENWAVVYAALRNLAFTHAWAGCLDTAVRTCDQAAGFSGRLGEAIVEGNPRDAARRAALLRDAGRVGEAFALLLRAQASLAPGGSPYWLAYCADQLALLYAMVGQPARARDLLAPDVAALPPEARVSRWITRARIARASGQAPPPAPPDMAAAAADPACPARWRLLATLENARSLAPSDAIAASRTVEAEAEALELGGVQLAAVALAANRAAEAGLAEAAGELASRAAELAQTRAPVGLTLPEMWLAIHRGLAAAGATAAAARLLERAAEWVEQAAAPNVPDEFKDSFRSRNPVHRAIVTGFGRMAPR